MFNNGQLIYKRRINVFNDRYNTTLMVENLGLHI